jgi:uncharacterized protein YkwD
VPREHVRWFETCGRSDSALSRAAEALANTQTVDASRLEPDEVKFWVRASGSPVVSPRAWRMQFEAEDEAAARKELGKQLPQGASKLPSVCGVSRRLVDDGRVRLVLVVAGSLAKMEPLPTVARRGEQLNFYAEPSVAMTHPVLVLLRPRGLPQELALEPRGSGWTAHFYGDEPGLYLLQLVADARGGPQAVLEAMLHVDAPPPTQPFMEPAVGERARNSALSAAEQLFQMLSAARRSEALPPVAKSAALERVAEAHATAMLRTGRVQHDLGDGDPQRRLEEAGVVVAAVGENLARASTATRAHRLIWYSPSHRRNMLDRHYDAVGIGVAQGDNGSLYVCQLLARGPSR